MEEVIKDGLMGLPALDEALLKRSVRKEGKSWRG